MLDYEARAGRSSTTSADRLVEFVHEHDLRVQWLLETHVHADHLSAASCLRSRLGGVIGIGEEIRAVQRVFSGVFNLDHGFALDGSQFDHLFAPNERFRVGDLIVQALHVPGHTPADMAYVAEGSSGEPVLAFIGDTLLMPDVGSARCDFPGGDARALYRSARRLLSLPAATRLYMCHDYPSGARPPRWTTSVAEQRRKNIHLRDGIDEAAFAALRAVRDATLPLPELMLPAIQVNIRAGTFPPAEANGTRYLKIPVDAG